MTCICIVVMEERDGIGRVPDVERLHRLMSHASRSDKLGCSEAVERERDRFVERVKICAP